MDCGPRYDTHQGTHVGVYDCHPYVHRPVLERVGRKELQCRLLSSARRNQDRGLRGCGDRSQAPSVVLLIQLKAEVVTCCKLRRFPDRHLFGHLQLPLRVFIDARTTNSTSGMANGGHSITVLAPDPAMAIPVLLRVMTSDDSFPSIKEIRYLLKNLQYCECRSRKSSGIL